MINISLSGQGYTDNRGAFGFDICKDVAGLQKAIDDAVSKGILVVVSAGNSSVNYRYKAPSSCKGVIVVSAVYQDGSITNFSGYSTKSDYTFDGVRDVNLSGNTQIAVDVADTHLFVPGFGVVNFGATSGTSAAAAMASGVLAMMKSYNPNLNYAQVSYILKNTSTLATTAHREPCTRLINAGAGMYFRNVTSSKLCGEGILNAKAAIDASLDPYSVIERKPIV